MHYSDTASNPYTQAQIVNMGNIILNKIGMLCCWILDWNACPNIQKIWTNFKQHLREAHHQLQETTFLQQGQTTFHGNAVHEILVELKK